MRPDECHDTDRPRRLQPPRPACLLVLAASLAMLTTACSANDGGGATARDTGTTAPTSPQPGGPTTTLEPSPTGPDPCFDEGEPFDGEARLYIEHNATDEDTGVHGMFDQEGLADGCVTTPDGTEILLVDPVGQLGELGINQFFFESREPPNDEYSIADLKADFPEGEYRISGIDHQGTRVVGTAVFTHAIPAPPAIVEPTVVPEEEASSNVLPATGFTVAWEPVTRTIDGDETDIVGYEVIVTQTDHDAPDSLSRPEYDVHLPPDATRLAVPDAFLQPDTLYELEVLALEDSGNQTISRGYLTTSA